MIKTFPNEDFFHLPLVSTTLVVHLELQISLRIFEKFETTLMVCLGAWGKLIHEKTLSSKISWHCPFNLLTQESNKQPRAKHNYTKKIWKCIISKYFALQVSHWDCRD
jgi:hypothetical protein